MFEEKCDYKEDCLNVIARIPTIVATLINHHAGWGNGPKSEPQLGLIENFVHMLNMPKKRPQELIEVLKLFAILHFDHGGGNLSTFVGKAVASGHEDMYGSLAAAMCALAGPLHGRANQDCLEFVQGIVKELGENPQEEAVEKLLRDKLKRNELVFGFGHAVLRVEDPRASIFYDLALQKYSSHHLVKIAHLLRKVGPKVLSENPKISDPYPNIDAISGIVLMAAGFEYPEYFPVLFGMSRVVGIARQITYERLEARVARELPLCGRSIFILATKRFQGNGI